MRLCIVRAAFTPTFTTCSRSSGCEFLGLLHASTPCLSSNAPSSKASWAGRQALATADWLHDLQVDSHRQSPCHIHEVYGQLGTNQVLSRSSLPACPPPAVQLVGSLNPVMAPTAHSQQLPAALAPVLLTPFSTPSLTSHQKPPLPLQVTRSGCGEGRCARLTHPCLHPKRMPAFQFRSQMHAPCSPNVHSNKEVEQLRHAPALLHTCGHAFAEQR